MKRKIDKNGVVHRDLPDKFLVVYPDEWIQPNPKKYLLACCDCGLVHEIDFRIKVDEKGKPHVQYRARRVKKKIRPSQKQK